VVARVEAMAGTEAMGGMVAVRAAVARMAVPVAVAGLSVAMVGGVRGAAAERAARRVGYPRPLAPAEKGLRPRPVDRQPASRPLEARLAWVKSAVAATAVAADAKGVATAAAVACGRSSWQVLRLSGRQDGGGTAAPR